MRIYIPQKNQLRVVKRFAWTPVPITDRPYAVWLQFYWLQQIYDSFYGWCDRTFYETDPNKGTP